MGRIFEGRDLTRVLGSHTATFAKITSVPAEMVQPGEEPQLTTEVRTDLFSIAHNALANAFLHAHAGRVEVRLDFEADGTRLSVSDDGVTSRRPGETAVPQRSGRCPCGAMSSRKRFARSSSSAPVARASIAVPGEDSYERGCSRLIRSAQPAWPPAVGACCILPVESHRAEENPVPTCAKWDPKDGAVGRSRAAAAAREPCVRALKAGGRRAHRARAWRDAGGREAAPPGGGPRERHQAPLLVESPRSLVWKRTGRV